MSPRSGSTRTIYIRLSPDSSVVPWRTVLATRWERGTTRGPGLDSTPTQTLNLTPNPAPLFAWFENFVVKNAGGRIPRTEKVSTQIAIQSYGSPVPPACKCFANIGRWRPLARKDLGCTENYERKVVAGDGSGMAGNGACRAFPRREIGRAVRDLPKNLGTCAATELEPLSPTMAS